MKSLALMLVASTLAGQSEPASPKPHVGAVGAAPALQLAYQREFAFLAAEKRALEQRLEEARLAHEARRAEAAAARAALELRVMEATMAADRVEAQLARQEMIGERDDETQGTFQAILAQAAALPAPPERPGARGTPEEGQAEAAGAPAAELSTSLRNAYARALSALRARSRVRQEPGTFFGAQGAKVEGTIVRVGEIAAFGIGAAEAGPLAPAGAGQLRVWPQGRAADARAFAAGKPLPRTQLFLFDSLEKAVEPKQEKSALDIVRAGGTIAWVIVALGAFAALLVLLRMMALGWAGRGAVGLGREVIGRLQEGDALGALDLAEQGRGAMAGVLRAALRARGLEREARMDRIDEEILRAFALIDRFGQLILVSAAVAPLLGLLGTVTGMIATFDAITEFGTGDPRVLAGGISEALITTELGLIVAIPSLLLGNLLSGAGERLKRRLETAALSVSNRCEPETGPGDGGSDDRARARVAAPPKPSLRQVG